MSLDVYRILGPETNGVDQQRGVKGWAVSFPCGLVYVDWNQAVFERSDQLSHPHISQYGSMNDLRSVTSGDVHIEYSFDYGQ